jgi:hypothetical protein
MRQLTNRYSVYYKTPSKARVLLDKFISIAILWLKYDKAQLSDAQNAVIAGTWKISEVAYGHVPAVW